MRQRLHVELLEGRDIPAVTVDTPTEAFSWVLVNEMRRDPAGFANQLDGLRKGTVASAFGFSKSDPVVGDLRRLLQYSSFPGHYGQAMQIMRSATPTGPLGWDDLLEDRAGVHNDWMRSHDFEHTGQDLPHKTYIPGYNSGYKGGDPDTWGYQGQYYWWGEDIGYTFGLMANSKAGYLAGRFGRVGFQERAAFIDTVSYMLEVNSPDMAHLDELLAPDHGPDINSRQFNAVGMDLDFYEGPYETRDGFGEATISTHRFGLYRPGGSGGFLTGVSFRDDNSNAHYDAGEGLGVTISVTGPSSFTETLDRLSTHGIFSRYVPNGTYTVSAVAANGANLGSRTVSINNSNGWFDFAAPAQVAAATRATVTAPVGSAGVRPTVTWTEIADAVGYEVRLTNRTTGRLNVYPGATTTTTSWTPPTDLIPGHSYTVVVRPLLAHLNGEWSPAWDFAVAAPKPIGPGVNATKLRPSISWNAVPGAKAYDVRVNDLTAGRIDIFAGQRTTGTNWAPPADLVSGRSYAVRVRAVNSLNMGLWGPGESFSIARPTLNGPAGSINSLQPSFGWSAIEGASRYIIAVDDLTTGRTSLYYQSTTSTSWQPPGDLVNGHSYRWHVSAYNAASLGRWSLASEFRVEL